jgi:hypoxanthine phosphoribosyltransferase
MNAPIINPLITEDQLRDRMDSLAKEIAAGVEKEVMVVSLLKGSFMFTADLSRALYRAGVRAQMDFITLSSYGSGTESSGNVVMKSPLTEEVKGKDVLIVDDILESGRTLKFAREEMLRHGAKTVKVAVLLEKPGKLAVEMEADFIGFTIPDKFVVGYGLDHANYYRELPFVGVVANAS